MSAAVTQTREVNSYIRAAPWLTFGSLQWWILGICRQNESRRFNRLNAKLITAKTRDVYWALNASAGSTFAARQAGAQHAIPDTATSNKMTPR